MSELVELNQSTGWISLGSSGMRLRAPGLKGSLIWRPSVEHAQFMGSAISPTMVAAGAPDQIEQALQEAGLADQGSLTIPAGTAFAAGPPNQIVLDRPIAQNRIEFAIYRDESGVISLHRPLPSPPTPAMLTATAAVHSSRTFHYVIPMRHAATPTGGVPQMAMLGGIPGKVVRFVGLAVTGIAGDAVYAAAKLWEDRYRAAQGFHWGGTLGALLATTPISMSVITVWIFAL